MEDGFKAHEEILYGGVANAGAVVRIGDEVRRPSNPHTATTHSFLRHLRSQNCEVVPEPLGIDELGRERLRFIPGDVAMPPFPKWSLSDAWLSSTASTIRTLHDASVGFVAESGAEWSAQMADTSGVHEVICHNDVCPENVVTRNGIAIALVDFDFAAPGRRIHDLAAFACMCVPLDDPVDAALLDRSGLDPFHRLRVLANGYGLEPAHGDLVDVIGERVESGGQFVLARVRAGEPAFVQMWNEMGGMARYDRRRAWFASNRDRLAAVLA